MAIAFFLLSHGANGQTVGRAAKALLRDSALQQAHIGISIYDVGKGKYLYNHQGDKYFIPASNVKLFTCYVGMKYLGDSLTGIQYVEDDTAFWLLPTGDPSLLHPDFKQHPVLDFLQGQKKQLNLLSNNWQEEALGYGWAWDDYNGEYMVERSPLPVHGNMAIYKLNIAAPDAFGRQFKWEIKPSYFGNLPYLFTIKPGNMVDMSDVLAKRTFTLERQRMGNSIFLEPAGAVFTKAEIPIYTDTLNTALAILKYGYLPNIKKGILHIDQSLRPDMPIKWQSIKSQPTDSMLLPMMHRSDNFYAEQTLLMIGQQQLGYMKTGDIIDTLLKTDLKDLPQRPKWVDGSGLSRYNLATPQSFVHLLQKMKAEFGMERLQNILPTGGEGTIRNYYQPLKGQIFVKTGTLGNNCALSGYLLTKKGNWLIFSVLANHYPSGATPVRRAVERFLTAIQRQY